jgi:hypothetical protein
MKKSGKKLCLPMKKALMDSINLETENPFIEKSTLNDTNPMEKVELLTFHKRKRIFMLKSRYDLLTNFIITHLGRVHQISLTELMELAIKKYESDEIGWDLIKAKQDLEAHGLVKIDYKKHCVQVISLKRSRRTFYNKKILLKKN